MGKRVVDVLIETLQAAGVKRCCGIVDELVDYSESTRVLVDELRAYASPNGET
jgi:hypothetical protein